MKTELFKNKVSKTHAVQMNDIPVLEADRTSMVHAQRFGPWNNGSEKFCVLRVRHLLLALSLLLAVSAQAQLNSSSSAIAGGGGTSSGGTFSLSGVVGQPEPGKMTGGGFGMD